MKKVELKVEDGGQWRRSFMVHGAGETCSDPHP